ncbi:MAG: hypothetical protein ACPGDD_05135, partial [Poseidonia sp.]
ARWRRGVGGYGAILTAFLFANSLDSELFSAIATVMSGMVALGFGFLFMQRMNEDDGIYQEVAAPPQAGSTGGTAAPSSAVKTPVEPTPKETTPEPVVEVEDEEDVLVVPDEEDDAMLDLDDDDEPEPVRASTEAVVAEVAEEEDVVEVSCPHCSERFGLDHGEVGEFVCPHCEEFLSWDGKVAQKIVQTPPRAGHSGLLDTGEGFALRLPKDAVDNILASLETTPHDGYVPVVAFGPNGQIMLTFEAANNGA